MTISLAQLLHECASYVERNEFHPDIYQALARLHSYISGHVNNSNVVSSYKDKYSSKHRSMKIEDTEENGYVLPDYLNSTFNSIHLKHAFGNVLKNSGKFEKNDKTENPCLYKKSPFQRPVNPKSSLIANGWIEQHSRSKMCIIWKDILISLVKGHHTAEETTIWIQRQVTNSNKQKYELEALHQIPMKWLKNVEYIDYYGDYRFSLKVHNISDEFVFRCPDMDSTMQWVATLSSALEMSLTSSEKYLRTSLDRNTLSTNNAGNYSVYHGKDITRSDSMSKLSSFARSYDDDFPMNKKSLSHLMYSYDNNDILHPVNNLKQNEQGPVSLSQNKEHRAKVHGAGYKTLGIEHVDLEKIAGHYTTKRISCKGQKSFLQINPSTSESMLNTGQKQVIFTLPMIENHDEHDENVIPENISIEKIDKFKGVNEEIYGNEDKNFLLNHKKLLSSKSWKEKRTTINVKNKKMNNNYQYRQVPEFVESFQQCQNPQQQNTFIFYNNKSPPPQPGIPPKRNKASIPTSSSHSQYRNRHDQKELFSSFLNEKSNPLPIFTKKWAIVSPLTSSEGDKHLSITNIKRYILVNWALKPPEYNLLRPIDWLVSSIHDIFPPVMGVTSHEYFKKWKPIKHEDLTLGAAMTGLNEEKLKKIVKKVRFFLHPDRLPRDMNAEQLFMCKMLWDLTSDGWEEFQKKKDILNWIK